MPKTILGMVNEYLHKNIDTPIFAINKEGKIVLINDAAANMFDKTAKELTNKKIWDILNDQEYNKVMYSLIKEQIHSTEEHLLFMPSNMIFKVKLIPIENRDHRVVASLAILKDYSNMHNLEKNIINTLTDISHKLKTPLTSIKGFIDTMLENNISDKKTTRHFLSIMHDETNRMGKLINNTLNIGAFISSERKTEKKPTNIVDMVKQSLMIMQPHIQKKKIKTSINFPKALPLADINRDVFIQAITNLLDNSIKFSGIGRKGKINIKIYKSSDNINIDIEDNGIGISSRDKNYIFERFYHIRNDAGSKYAGIGLGLSITKQIVEEHGGKITFKSTINKGSTFTISIPAVTPGVPIQTQTKKES